MTPSHYPVLIIGAGPAGLAVSKCLKDAGIDHLTLEKGSDCGTSWERYYSNLVLHTGKHLSNLPGMPFLRKTPLFPTRVQFLEYLRNYRLKFDLPVQTGSEVLDASRNGEMWKISLESYTLTCDVLVVASGIFSHPVVPPFQGMENFSGQVMHSSDYRVPQPFTGKRILVIGIGNSGGEITAELAEAGASPVICVRSGAHLMPLRIFGLPTQYWAAILGVFPPGVRLKIMEATRFVNERLKGPSPIPRSPASLLDDVPLIGDHLPRVLKTGKARLKPGIKEFRGPEAIFQDGTRETFDAVILATGFRAELSYLKDRIRRDAKGFGMRRGVQSLDLPDLFFCGHNYSTTGALFNIRRDSKIICKMAQELLRRSARAIS